MFAMLSSYLDPEFMAAHPDIIITTPDGETLTYRVFEARRSDAWDDVYSLDFSDSSAANELFSSTPVSAGRFLVMSTCLNGPNRDMRLLVYAQMYTCAR